MIIDTHAHLDMDHYDADRSNVIQKAYEDGVKLILNVGTNVEGSKRSLDLAQKYDFIYAACGIHPHDADNLPSSAFTDIENLLKEPKVIALGEVGLDYFKNYSQKKSQINLFQKMIALAKKYKKPLIIHSRDAKIDTLRILKEEGANEVGGILHCFSGDNELLTEALSLGFYISFAGQVTFPRATSLQELVKKVPTERLLIETDCPFLSPQFKRGKRNEPSYIQHTLEKIASLRGVSTCDIERVTSVNFSRLFNITTEDFNTTHNLSYQIRNSLYLNITNRCSNVCIFCSKFDSFYVQGHNLKLDHEPTLNEILNAIDDPKKYDEIVLCGFGEPTMRLDLVKEIAKNIKTNGGITRLNTNGHGNIINNRNILPELSGLIDSISISLNAENEKTYNELCRPVFSGNIYDKVCQFIIESKKHIPHVCASVIDMPDSINIEECEKIVLEKFKVDFRVRKYNMVGS